MSNVAQRLLLFFIGLPLLVAIILFMPWARHGAIVSVVLAFSAGGALELARLFRARGVALPEWSFVALGLVPPAAAYLGCFLSGGQAPLAAAGALALGAALAAIGALAPFALVSKEGIEQALPRASALGFASLYPGLLAGFIVLLASEPPHATESILVFCALTFGNDSLAWLAGVTLGRKRGIIAVSPNKSVAGFVAGFLGTIALALAAPLAFPESLGKAGAWQLAALGAVVAAAGIFGDLFESALKRSAGAKDSGSFVPGRGGFLDSIDSLLFAAPLFYGLCLLMGLFR